MKIINANNQVIGKVEQDGKNPFHYRYYGKNNITFPVHANGLPSACSQVCKYFGEGHFYLLFTI